MKENLEALFVFLLFIVFGGLVVWSAVETNSPQKTFKSKEKLKPDYELTTDGKTIDTVWVYEIEK